MKNGLLEVLKKEYGDFLIEWRKNKLFLLWNHHKYLHPIRDAPRVFVSKCAKKPIKHEYSPNVFYIHSYEER
jgi:hypothetical protein